MHLTPRARPDVSPFAVSSRLHWVIAELDARGEIDAHAAMCLRHGIDAGLMVNFKAIVVDLRDLTSIGATGLALFVRACADCRSRGAELGLLISGRASHVPIAYAFASAGLGGQLDYTGEPPAPAGALPHVPRLHERSTRSRARFRLGRWAR